MEDQQEGKHPPANEEPSEAPGPAAESTGEVIGSAAIRPVFLGNLHINYEAADVQAIFTRPFKAPGSPEGTINPIPVDRVDLKRGYCFVFLKDASSQEEKEKVERFVSALNGM
jgi:hypothetical protein